MTNIPIPQDSGSLGSQQTSSAPPVTTTPDSPLEGLPIIARRVEGLVITHPQDMGGNVVATLLSGMLSQTSDDLQKTRIELNNAHENYSRLSQECSEAKTKSAVLQEKVDANARVQDQREIGIFIGTVIVGIGIELYKNNIEKLGWIVGALGLLLLYLSRFHKSKGAEK